MSPKLALLLCVLVWTIAALFHLLCRRLKERYALFVERYRFQLLPCFLSISTARSSLFTKQIKRIGQFNSVFFEYWFSGGILCGVVGLVVSISLLASNVVGWFISVVTVQPPPSSHIMLMIPGVTIPSSSFGYLFIAIFVSMIFHELGHALSAACYGIQSTRIGVFLAICFPGAFVDIKYEGGYEALPLFRKLRVVCGGIWHNVVLFGICYGIILIVPLIFFPFYFPPGHGVMITSVLDHRMISSTFHPFAVISSIDNHNIHTSNDLIHAVQQITSAPLEGRCISADIIGEYRGGDLSCCNSSIPADTRQCFFVERDHLKDNQVCLSVRKYWKTNEHCLSTKDCTLQHATSTDDNHRVCTWPQLEIGERIMQVAFSDSKIEFITTFPTYFLSSVQVSDYVPRSWLFSFFPQNLLAFLSLPDVMLTTLRFICGVSMSLAILNSTPVYYSDGALLVDTVLLALSNYCSWFKKHRSQVQPAVLLLSSVLLLLSVCLSFIQLMQQMKFFK
eukprot:TRINITY_DN6341_c0_g1_i1.p1 TRINITY_DN6341_c0_g1~~TRINITY_DN6341_c0_g1_i1.p1  ORF type:complete len:506 (+),score=15.04 TRINITY_DN6341_c0_g1_i1:65-1582(+)